MSPQILTVCAALLRRRAALMGFSASDADDLTQRTLVACWRKADRIEPGKERAFARAVLAREVMRARRTNSRRREAPPEEAPPQSTGATRLDVLLQQQRDLARVADLLDTVSPEQRVVFGLHVLDGLTCEQIAEQRQLPLGTVKTRLRAVRKLIESLQEPAS